MADDDDYAKLIAGFAHVSLPLDEPNYLAAFQRIAERRGHGDGKIRPDFDPVLSRDVVDACLSGRKIENYRPALEHFGFRYTPPERLPPYDDGRFRDVGEWRNPRALRANGARGLAFTDHDILSQFPSPEAFATWMEKHNTAARLAAVGLFLSADGKKLREPRR